LNYWAAFGSIEDATERSNVGFTGLMYQPPPWIEGFVGRSERLEQIENIVVHNCATAG